MTFRSRAVSGEDPPSRFGPHCPQAGELLYTRAFLLQALFRLIRRPAKPRPRACHLSPSSPCEPIGRPVSQAHERCHHAAPAEGSHLSVPPPTALECECRVCGRSPGQLRIFPHSIVPSQRRGHGLLHHLAEMSTLCVNCLASAPAACFDEAMSPPDRLSTRGQPKRPSASRARQFPGLCGFRHAQELAIASE